MRLMHAAASEPNIEPGSHDAHLASSFGVQQNLIALSLRSSPRS
jgi:hypothetical protein